MQKEKSLLLHRISHKDHPIIRDLLFAGLSFLLVFLFGILIFSLNGFSPFVSGGKTILMSDGNGQYIAYYRDYRNILLNHGSLIYTLKKCFGGDYQSIFSYYLASPFNLLLVLVKEAEIPDFLIFSNLAKMAIAGFQMSLLLSRQGKNNRFLSLALSFSYGVMSYCFVYFFTPMWLDGAMVLPLVVLGLLDMMKKKEYWLYPLALAYALYSSWYTGAMICFFSVLFFLDEFFFHTEKEKRNNGNVFRFLLLSLSGGLLSAVGWLTAFSHFSGTKVGFNSVELGLFTETLGDFFSGFLTLGYNVPSLSYSYGYSPLFTSLPVLVLALLYFCNPANPGKERIGDGILFLFFSLSCIYGPLYLLWHGLAYPTWFPTRFAFIFSFFLVYLGGKESRSLSSSPLWSYLIPLLLPLPVYFLIAKTGNKYISGQPFDYIGLLLYEGAVVILFLCTFFSSRPKKPHPKSVLALSLLILPTAFYSAYLGEDRVLKKNSGEMEYLSSDTYAVADSLSSEIDALQSSDPTLFRMEDTFNRAGVLDYNDNDPMFYSYNGLSHFSSTEKRNVMDYMGKVGYASNGYFEHFSYGSTLGISSFFGVKYILDNGENTFPYLSSLQRSTGNLVSVYENPYALPLGFATSKNTATFVNEGDYDEETGKVNWYDKFRYLNEIYKEAVSEEDYVPIYTKIPYSAYVAGSGASVTIDEDQNHCLTSSSKTSTLLISFTVDKEGYGKNLYITLNNTFNGMDFKLDGKSVRFSDYWSNGIYGFQDTSSHSHTLEMKTSDVLDHVVLEPCIAYENEDAVASMTAALKKQASFDLKETNSLFSYTLSGTFSLEKENQSFLFTIPYENNVSIKIDGKKQKTETRFNIFSSTDLDGLSKGTHTVSFTYTDKGRILGFLFSLLGLASVVLSSVFFLRSDRREEKRTEEKN